MFAIANLLSAFAQVLDILLVFLEATVFVYAALFWINAYSHNPPVKVVGGVLLGVLLAFFLGGIYGLVLGVIVAVLTVSNMGLLMSAVQPVSEFLLRPIRRLLPPWRMNGIDISPVLIILAIEFTRKFLIPTLFELSNHLR